MTRAGWASVLLFLAACTAQKSAPDAGTVPDAGRWRVVLDELNATLLSSWESSDGVLYAVGGTSNTALVLRHDSDGWWQMDPGTTRTLWWVHGFSANDVFAVGAQGVVTHFDGTRWTVESEGGDYTLFGAWGVSPEQMVAVGGVVTASSPRPVIVGRSVGWKEVWTNALPADRPLFKVWGTGSELFVVGDHGLVARGSPGDFTPFSALTTERLTTVHGAGNEVYAVGGIQAPVMIRFDVDQWHTVDVPGTPQLLNGVAVNGAGEVVIVGLDGYLAEGRGDVFAEEKPLTRRGLHGVAVTHDGFVAVGGSLLGSFGHGVLLARGKLEGGSARSWPYPGVRFDAGMPTMDAGVDAGPVDAGVEDAGMDAGTEDAGPQDAGPEDAGMDAGPEDAGSDAGPADAGPSDGGLLGPGESCDQALLGCESGLECWFVFGPFKNYCGGLCNDASDCAAYGTGACCQLPGPQVTTPVCLSRATGVCDAGP